MIETKQKLSTNVENLLKHAFKMLNFYLSYKLFFIVYMWSKFIQKLQTVLFQSKIKLL